MTVELERFEAKFAVAGEAAERDLDLYIRAAGNLRRLLEAIGLQRRLKIALRALHVTNFRVGHTQIALPAGVARIGLG